MIFNFRSKREKYKYFNNTELSMNTTVLGEIRKIRFLGIIINNKLTWDDHKSHLKANVNKTLGIIYNCRNIIKQSHLINMYNLFIQPYFNYCISLWGSSIKYKTDPLINLQNKIMRTLFSCKRTDDAWENDTNHCILKIKHLYYLEIAKLCYKHHTGIT